MSGASYSDVQTYGGLRELYDDEEHYQENIVSSFFNEIRKGSEDDADWDGLHWNVQVTFQLNESFGARVDGERLPDPDIQKGVFAQFTSKLMYAQVEATTYAGSRGYNKGRGNAGKYLDDLIKGTLLTFNSNLDSDAYGNGRGYRATILTATAAQTSFTVSFSTRLRAGMVLDWYDSTYTTKRGTIKIALKGVDRINKTVYVDTTLFSLAVPTGAVAGDVLLVAGSLDSNEPSDGRHMGGIDRICDNTVSCGTLDSSTYALWAATNLAAAQANPNQELLQQYIDQYNGISGVYPDLFAFNSAWKRGYLSGFLGQRRFTSNSYDTGAASVTWSAVKMGTDDSGKKPQQMKMLEDKNCDPSKTIFSNRSAWFFKADYSNEPHLADEDGADMRFRIGFDSMQGFIRFWGNTCVKQRNAIGQITGWAVPNGAL